MNEIYNLKKKIKLLEILSGWFKMHPAYRVHSKATGRYKECIVVIFCYFRPEYSRWVLKKKKYSLFLSVIFKKLEIADLTGHKKSNIGRTQAGKTYFSRQPIL